jgi:ubiquinone/menaquinone biosynthesis C-methylase UbiE
MDQDTMKQLAQQLRKPEGEMGKKVAEQMNSGNELMNRTTLTYLNACANDSILEIGMGNGKFVKDILAIDPSINYVGCDYSNLMVQEASVLNASWIANKQAQFIQTTADVIPFQDKHFSKAFTVNTIYFWEDPNKELAEIHRVLTRGAKFVLTVRALESMKSIPVTQYNFTLYNQEQLVHLLTANGFKVKEVVELAEPARELFNGSKVKLDSWIFCTEAN